MLMGLVKKLQKIHPKVLVKKNHDEPSLDLKKEKKKDKNCISF